jgi:flagellar biosynthesis/type III secretory pathway protein FliH
VSGARPDAEDDECFVDTENGEVNISVSSQIEQIGGELRNLTV